ncbi:MAG: PQQ-binding-like beta-propeller repeat protein [Candidatus Poribacteria bacterium]|nr:PQQ-binding-like beta-propeller repeat protein [Candidatus Poribacteria bacterium]
MRKAKLKRLSIVSNSRFANSSVRTANSQRFPTANRKLFLTTSLLLVFLASANPAYAVIPQLLGPLTALLSIVPQILAFVGVALLTALVFARDTVKMFFYKCRDFAAAHKVTATIFSVVILVGFVWGTYLLIDTARNWTPLTPEANVQNTSTGNTNVSRAWSTFRGGKNRTGHVDGLPGPTHGTLAWVFREEEAMAVDFSSSPAIVGNRLYIGSSHGSIFSLGGATYCIDTESKKVIWRHSSRIPIFSPPAVAGGRVYIGEGYHQDSNCHLRCLDAKTGDLIWSFKTTSHVESTPFISQGKLYFTAGADGVYCIDALEGQQIWHYGGVHADMSPVVHKGIVYFGTGYDGYQILAVNAETGSEIWSKQMPYPVWGSPSVHEDIVFFGLGRGNFSESATIPAGKVVALNAETGDLVWEHEAEDAVLTAIAVQEGYVIFGSRDGYVYCLGAMDGKLNWKTDIGGPVVSSPAVTPRVIYAAAKNGYIYALSADSGEMQWEFDTRSVTRNIELYSSPAVANGLLYIGSSDRYIFCLGGDAPGTIIGNR